jgi:repressor LexA
MEEEFEINTDILQNPETLSLDEFLIENPDSSYIYTVTNNSLVKRGIYSKDIVILQRGKNVKEGQIVLAELEEGEFSLIEYVKAKKMKVEAVVVGLVRKYL